MQLLIQVKAKQSTFVSTVLSIGLLEYLNDLFQHLGALFQQDCPDPLPSLQPLIVMPMIFFSFHHKFCRET